jgi:hypothetical protein
MGIEQLLQRLQTRVTGVTGLQDCFKKDFSVTPKKTAELEVTEVDFPVTPATHCNLRTFTANVNEFNDVTSVTLVTPEKIESQSQAQTCAGCHHVSRYGNCTIPQRSRLSEKYMLISHPNHGTDCVAYEPKLNPLAKEALALASIAFREGAISEEEHSHATDSIQSMLMTPVTFANGSSLSPLVKKVSQGDPRGRSF